MLSRTPIAKSIHIANEKLQTCSEKERTSLLNILDQLDAAEDAGVTTVISVKSYCENGKFFFCFMGIPGAYYTLTDSTLLVLTDKRTHEGVPTGKQLLMEWAVVIKDTGLYAGDKAIVAYDNTRFYGNQVGEKVRARRMGNTPAGTAETTR